jgi:hypothetical protein
MRFVGKAFGSDMMRYPRFAYGRWMDDGKWCIGSGYESMGGWDCITGYLRWAGQRLGYGREQFTSHFLKISLSLA